MYLEDVDFLSIGLWIASVGFLLFSSYGFLLIYVRMSSGRMLNGTFISAS